MMAELSPEMWAYLFAALIFLGAMAGFLAGLLGIGGGVVLVPGLFYIFTLMGFESGALMHVAVGTSLAVIVPTGLASARAHWRKDSVDPALVRSIGAGILAGVILGAVLADILSGAALRMVFAAAIAMLALIMLLDPGRFRLLDAVPPAPWSAVAGVVIGTVSTLIGIGGATLSVPFMSFCQVPIRRAIGTASALGLVIAVPGALGFMLIGLGEEGRPPLSLGYVNLAAWMLIIPAGILAAPLGVRTAHAVPVGILKKGFAVFMVLVAVKMGVDVL